MLAAQNLNRALAAGWPGFDIGERIPLSDIARAHELAERPVRPGRIVVKLLTGVVAARTALRASVLTAG